MTKSTILIVEDDEALREMLRFLLERKGYRAMKARDTNEADKCIKKKIPDLVLLDWMLPGMDGIDYAQKLKSQPLTLDTCIIMITAKGEEEDKIKGLDHGADDYITKPFSTNELLARIRAGIRRNRPQQTGEPIICKDIVINPQEHTLKINDEFIEIGIKEFELLYLFMRKPDRVYNRARLLDKIWGKDKYVDERTVDVYIRRLRSVLEKHNHHKLIKTVRGVGYRLSST